MTDGNNTGDKTLSVTGKPTLSLKRPGDNTVGTVRQSFSHGRSKTVAVEVVKRRTGPVPVAPQQPSAPQPMQPLAPALPQRVLTIGGAPGPAPKPVLQQKPQGGLVLRTLSDSEQNARQAVLMDASRRDSEERLQADAESKQRAERNEAEQRERDAAEARKREEEDRRVRDDFLRRRGQDEAVRRLGEEPRPPRPAPSSSAGPAPSSSGARFDGPRSQGDRPQRLDGNSFRSGTAPSGERPSSGDRALDRGPRPAGGSNDRPPRPAGASTGFPDRGPRPAGASTGSSSAGSPRPSGGGYAGSRPAGSGFGAPRPPGASTARFGFVRPGATPTSEPAVVQENRRVAPPSATMRSRELPDQENSAAKRKVGAKIVRSPSGGDAGRDRSRLTLTNALETTEERMRSVAAYRRRVQRMKGGAVESKEKVYREVILPETISIQELANRMSERGVDIIRMLMKQGQMHKITDVIDADTAELIAQEMGHTVRRVAESDVEDGIFGVEDPPEMLLPRSPVVTIMGHVDHGKTSLLDAIRKTNVVTGEAGGITQHIGAYQVISPSGGEITFIDTPGHAAFTQMRARGAKVTDIVILVVAANDSVMPQTIEAINHAKAAKVPIIVAINKIDLPDSKAERVRTDLLQHNIQVESLGGDTLEVEVSAKTGKNLDKLLETILLQSEVLDLMANPDRVAEGTVIEAKLDKGRGPVATVLIQKGTLVHGDIVVAGSEWGRIRAIINDKGEQIDFAGPSMPVEVLGFSAAPEAGDRLAVVETEARARDVTSYRLRTKREKALARVAASGKSLADIMSQIKEAGKKELPLIIKGDVQGSVEAIAGALDKISTSEVMARVIHSAVGGITESDITLANTTGAVVLGFNVRAHKEARESSERAGVEIRYYNIIYDLVDDIKLAMAGLLPPTLREEMLGNAKILEVFNITKTGKVAGCMVTDGKVERGAKVRLIRDNVVIHEGTLKTLKRFKDEVKEVVVGQECGMAFEKYEDMRAGDIIECYRVEEVKRTL